MKWLSAGLTFVNVTTVCGLLGGIAAHGLSKTVALAAAIAGLAAALLAYGGTSDAAAKEEAPEVTPNGPTRESKPARDPKQSRTVLGPAARRYRSIWLWLVVAVFAMFAFRSFLNVLFIDGNELKIQNPNNLGDLSLHLTYINNFASGVPLWPENPIYVFSKLRYPAGIDLFNALLVCLDISVIRGLVWVGLLASAALCYALYRWGGAFTIAGFLFNGGVAGYQWFRNYQWNDYQTSNYIAWKSLALTMLVTQRGLLYALPAGLLLLIHWRAKFFPRDQEIATETVSSPSLSSEPPPEPAPSSSPELAPSSSSEPAPSSSSESSPSSSSELGVSEAVVLAAPALTVPAAPAAPLSRGIVPFWVELSVYATMPLFHVHTFMALSAVLLFLFFFLNARARIQLAWLGALAFVPATFFVYLITDHFQAGSVMHWNPGWVQNNGDFARPLAAFTSQPATVPPPVPGFLGTVNHFVQFWVINFGITLPLIIALLVLLIIRAWKQRDEPAPVKVRLIAVLVTLALVLITVVGLIAYFSLGYSLFVVLALIPPVAVAIMIPLFASLLSRNWKQTIPLSTQLGFVIPAVALFLFACLVKTAPWEWDNIKLIIWSYLIVLPFVWSEVVSRWPFPVRAVVCIALFGSGFLTLFGGLAAGETGYGMADRTELDAVGVAVRKLPAEARYAAFPTFNHPLLLQGRKVVEGYPGHVWTQGFDFGPNNPKFETLMNGNPGWKKAAGDFQVRYMFWGREEKAHYPQSKRPWEQESKLVDSGPWGAIYDLESPRAAPLPPPAPSAPPATSIAPVPQG